MIPNPVPAQLPTPNHPPPQKKKLKAAWKSDAMDSLSLSLSSGWGNVKNKKWNVLLAGEMLKTFFLSENVLVTGEILKRVKMLKMGEPCLCTRHRYTNIAPPIFYILTF